MTIEVLELNKPKQLTPLIKSGNVLVLYYADWCGYCVSFKPMWKEFITKIKKLNSNSFSIVSIENTFLKKEEELLNEAEGFPTIKFYKDKNLKNPILYETERTIDNLINFVNKHKSTSNKKLTPKKKGKQIKKGKKPKNKKPVLKSKRKPVFKVSSNKTKKRFTVPNRKLNKVKSLKDNENYYSVKELEKIRKEFKQSNKIEKTLLQNMNREFKI